ncbi:MAG TPA: hypothetical protein VGG68_14380 [Caulobacteraceae bacterium]|jgi:hypothetical protein
MPLLIPPAVNYPSPPISMPAFWQREPNEGPRFIPLEIDWAIMGGALNCVALNLDNYGASVQNFTQIVALKVDNSACSADVQFIFPDTGDTVTIPGYSPCVIVPVFTNGRNLFVLLLGSEVASDVTRAQVHNSLPPPLVIPASDQAQLTATFSNIPMDGVTTTQLIPAAISGTLEAISLYAAANTVASAFSDQLTVQDGTAKLIAVAQASVQTGGTIDALLLNSTQMRVVFTNGLQLLQAATGTPAGHIVANLLYRTP